MAVKMEGPLTKWTNVVQGWQYRWFVLDDHTGLLSYYTSKDRMMRGARRGCLRLKGGKVGINDEDDSTFTITCDHRTFHFQAQDAEERKKWVKCLEETILKHGSEGITGPFDNFTMTEEELNRKMQEAEAYFKILTQQVKKLESQVNHSTSMKPERAFMLKDSLTQMIESMGQTIELLHNAKISLAKKVPVPVLDNQNVSPAHTNTDGSTTALTVNDEPSLPSSPSDPGLSPLPSARSTDSSAGSTDIEILEVGCEALEIVSDPQSIANAQVKSEAEVIEDKSPTFMPPFETVPISSYTSSDEEDGDEFFDAEEEINEIAVDEIETSLKLEEQSDVSARKLNIDTDILVDMNDVIKTEEQKKYSLQQNVKIIGQPGEEDEYENECESEEEDADMSSHGSVITHLISQVKIGMDLTKVTLPTFILERRSLLEMYADFFAHPDLFKGIPDLDDPADRMLQVLRWYLSSFHAGRKSTVAKKPYNPILGETFQCFFNLTDDSTYRKDENNLSKEGPIPWGTKEDVTFVAEQVSHHPPISAFYAECENKNVCFNAHIWTKSKFLGLSIGVHMAGTGNVFVSKYDEEYIMTFPNAYARSILGVPWVELGGKTEITCPKTGYNAQIELLTKPFYGGKRNRITAEVYAPSQKKPILSVHGEWNGVMYAKRPNSSTTEVFVDTFNMPIVQKKVRKIHTQEEFESRRLWQDVTHALKVNDIETATGGKHKLEEKQRSDARVRKETDTKWVTRLFDEEEVAEGERLFHYKWPLYKRKGLPKPGAS